MINFQSMTKRFMVWDKEERQFLTYLSSKSVDFEYLLMLIDHHHITLSELGSRYILIQSTNLFDKDGKEIFEGSILQGQIPELFNEEGRDKIGVVTYSTECGNYKVDFITQQKHEISSVGFCSFSDIIIMGHILSNKELLKDANE